MIVLLMLFHVFLIKIFNSILLPGLMIYATEITCKTVEIDYKTT